MRYNKDATDKQAFLFATIEPYPANVCLSVTGKSANVGCGFMHGGRNAKNRKIVISTRKDIAYVQS